MFVASPSQVGKPANCAFYVHDVAELDDPDRCFLLSAEDFARVNPNTGTAPIFRTRRDAEITTAIYDRLPVLVNRSSGEAEKAWPVKYSTMFHMTNDSALFRTLLADQTSFPKASWLLAFKDVTAPTNVRSMIAALIPGSGVGNTLPVLSLEDMDAEATALLLANLNSVPFDYAARQKIQGQHLNWYIVEQLPVVPPERYEAVRFGPKAVAEIVREAVLELTYTSAIYWLPLT